MHADAAQAVGKVPVSVDELGVDMLTIAGHKLYAPKGDRATGSSKVSRRNVTSWATAARPPREERLPWHIYFGWARVEH